MFSTTQECLNTAGFCSSTMTRGTMRGVSNGLPPSWDGKNACKRFTAVIYWNGAAVSPSTILSNVCHIADQPFRPQAGCKYSISSS